MRKALAADCSMTLQRTPLSEKHLLTLQHRFVTLLHPYVQLLVAVQLQQVLLGLLQARLQVEGQLQVLLLQVLQLQQVLLLGLLQVWLQAAGQAAAGSAAGS